MPYGMSPFGTVNKRLLPCGSGNPLRPFTFGQRDENLTGLGTKEAFQGVALRPFTNVAMSN